MKNKILLLAAFCLSVYFVQAQHISNCPVSPNPIDVKQPDGKTLTCIPIGNLLVSYNETTDGYTLLETPDGEMQYAVQNGQDMKFSGLAAHNVGKRSKAELEFLSQTKKHIRYGEDFINNILSNVRQQNEAAPIDANGNKKDDINAFPTTGNRRLLMILIQYPDLKSKYAKSNFDDMMNKTNYNNTGSFKDYYKRVSFNKLNITVDVYGWYMASNGYKTYGRVNGNSAARPLVAEAVDSAEKKGGVNFKNYDNDGDGYVDAVVVVHAGQGAEEGGSNTNYVWSHRYNLGSSYSRKYDGVTIYDYMIQPETRVSGGVHQVGIGVFCHEFGHILGLPDLYSTGYINSGAGEWCLMSGGSWNGSEAVPSTYSAFCRVWLKWITPIDLSTTGSYTMRPVVENGLVYKIKTPVSNEYFLLENRQYKYNDYYLPGRGLAVWHIDSKIMTSVSSEWYGNYVQDGSHMGMLLVQADGKKHLENKTNQGDAGDLFPGSTKNTKFDDATTPDAKTYNGTLSKIKLSLITQNADSSVSFNFGAVATADFYLLNNSTFNVCSNSPVSFVNNSSFATSYVWDFGDGSAASTSTNPVHTYSKSGSYWVKLYAQSGSVTVSDSSLLTVSANSVAGFEIDSTNTQLGYLKNTSSNATIYTWKWGDGGTSYYTQVHVKHKYADTGYYTVTLIAKNAAGCSDTFSMEIHIGKPLVGIEELTSDNFISAYPNPFSNEIYVQFKNTKTKSLQAELYNTLGQKINTSSSVLNSQNDITVLSLPSTLQNGIYLLVVKTTDGNKYNIKLIKN